MKKEPTIRIKDIGTKCDIEVSVSLYYKIFCRQVVSKYFHVYNKVFKSQGIELNDLKQDILLMLWEILSNNKKTKKITDDKIGGYLYNSTKRKLNNIVSKALTTYRRMVSLNICHADSVSHEEAEVPELKSDVLLSMLDGSKKESLKSIIKKTCTKKEATAIKKYYFQEEKMLVVAIDMGITKQRVSALIKRALEKLKVKLEDKVRSNYGKEDY